MRNGLAKQLATMMMVVIVMLSGASVSSIAKGSCLVDAPVSVYSVADAHCLSLSALEQAAEPTDASCSPFAPASACAMSGPVLTPSPQGLMKVPYPQSLPEQLEKPPRFFLSF